MTFADRDNIIRMISSKESNGSVAYTLAGRRARISTSKLPTLLSRSIYVKFESDLPWHASRGHKESRAKLVLRDKHY